MNTSTLFAGTPPDTSDSFYRKTIVGSWKIQIKGGGIELNAVDTFQKDGQLIQKGKVETGKGTIGLDFTSEWKIENGVLISTVTSASHPDLVPVGFVTKDKIIFMDTDTFKCVTEKGELETHIKIKP